MQMALVSIVGGFVTGAITFRGMLFPSLAADLFAELLTAIDVTQLSQNRSVDVGVGVCSSAPSGILSFIR
jgi:hypothetical protein